MKSLSLFVISCLTAFSIFAQSTVTITSASTGNRSRQILIDEKTYSLVSTTTDGASTASANAVIITDLQPGQHTLQIVRNNNNNANTNNSRNKTTFTLRSGYDMQITINRDGSVQQKETRIAKGYVKKTPMAGASFTIILNDVKKQKTIAAKTAAVKKAFTNTKNYFTTNQAKQLIQLVSSQASRLELAKLSYRAITDPDNFSELDPLLTEVNQDALASYVDTYKINNPVYTRPGNNNNNANNNNQNTGYKTPMTTANYNVLYKNIENEWRSTEKMTALTNAFTNTNNYFTTNQAGRLIQLVSNENDRLQLAKASYRSITDPSNFIQINELLPSQASKDALITYVNWYTSTNGTATTNTGTSNPYKAPMAEANFNKLVQDVKNEWMPGAKMNLLTAAFANINNYFSTNQAGQLIQLVSDEDNRLLLAKSAYRNITDPANFTLLYQLFNYQSNRDALAAYINSYNTNSPSGTTSQYKTPMSDANFNQVLNDVKAQWLPFGKLNALTTTFSNPNNYFTSSQTKQLIQLVSDEDNRLQLAKSSYRNMTDRPNFALLYDLFNTQASKDAFASYVGSYKDSAGY